MDHVTSRDGTPIAFDKVGQGPAIILVDGALLSRGFGTAAALAKSLQSDFTVYCYDRRGRGDSGDSPTYALEREVEDLGAMIEVAGGTAFVYGVSSGGGIALEAAARGLGVSKLVLYELPMIVDGARAPISPDFLPALRDAVASGRRGAAVRMFLRLIGTPAPITLVMSVLPMFKKLKAIAHTLVYDMTIMEPLLSGKPIPEGRWSQVTVPTLVADGAKSPAWMRNGAAALAAALPRGRHHSVPGQTHALKPEAIAPVIRDFCLNGTSQ